MAVHGVARARRVVAAAYVRQHADASTLVLVEQLERENAWLRASLAAKRRYGTARSGRRVFGLTIAVSLVVAGAGIVLGWAFLTADGSCVRQGIDARVRGGDRASVATVACEARP